MSVKNYMIWKWLIQNEFLLTITIEKKGINEIEDFHQSKKIGWAIDFEISLFIFAFFMRKKIKAISV